MARAEIRYFAGYRDEELGLVQGEQIKESEIFEGPDAIKQGSKRFKQIMKSEREILPWLLHASVWRDFEDNMGADLTLRIGPEPRWSEAYLREHGLGKYKYLE